MRRKALLGVVVVGAAAALPLSTTTGFAQAPAPAPATQQPPPPPATAIEPRWQVQPTPQPAPIPPQTTPQTTRGYTEFDKLLKPRNWPRQDDINRMPETPSDREDDQYGLRSAPAYDATRPNNPLGPY